MCLLEEAATIRALVGCSLYFLLIHKLILFTLERYCFFPFCFEKECNLFKMFIRHQELNYNV